MFHFKSGLNRTAIAGALAVGTAVAVSSFTVVRAEHAKPDKSKVYSCSSGTACLEGNSTGASTTGLYGIATTNTGVLGTSAATNGNSGVAGISTASSGSGHGVYGRSSNGQGVYGSSSSSNGVEGHATANAGLGVAGFSTASAGAGVAGFQLNTSSNSGNGVHAESADTTGSWVALYGQGDNTETSLFTVFNTVTGGYCTVDPYGNLSCTGSTDVKTMRSHHLTSSGQHVLAYAAESASATLDDVGTARMIDGVANVAIDRAFGQAIDARTGYHVFLTPMGDTRGLYVSAKAPGGFEVREAQGGRSTLSFDYRIVARPMDAKTDRLPLAPVTRLAGAARERQRRH
jgi:hypothetical protein